jgi:hypothetical protein
VRTWDGDGAPSPFAPAAHFDTGLTDAGWSGAQWIRRVTSGADSRPHVRRRRRGRAALRGRTGGRAVFTVGAGATHFSIGATAPGTVGGTVPATLSLTLGPPASFGAFTPGVAKEHSARTSASVTSTAGNAALSVSPARLANGPFHLAQPVAVEPAKSIWTGPVSSDAFSIGFRQSALGGLLGRSAPT